MQSLTNHLAKHHITFVPMEKRDEEYVVKVIYDKEYTIIFDDEYDDVKSGSQELLLAMLLMELDAEEPRNDDLPELAKTFPRIELPFSYLDWQLNAGTAQQLRKSKQPR